MMKKGVFLLMIAGLMSLFGCKQTYKVDYQGYKGSFSNAKDAYSAGEKVSLCFSLIASDTDYSFIVDGQPVTVRYENNVYWLDFTMPEHDIVIDVSEVNTMDYYVNESLALVETEDVIVPDAVSTYVESYEDDILTIVVHNRTSDTICYGEAYQLYKVEGEEFVEIQSELSFIEIAYELEANQDVTLECDLSYFGHLESGDYRIVKTAEIQADFSLEQGIIYD